MVLMRTTYGLFIDYTISIFMVKIQTEYNSNVSDHLLRQLEKKLLFGAYVINATL